MDLVTPCGKRMTMGKWVEVHIFKCQVCALFYLRTSRTPKKPDKKAWF